MDTAALTFRAGAQEESGALEHGFAGCEAEIRAAHAWFLARPDETRSTPNEIRHTHSAATASDDRGAARRSRPVRDLDLLNTGTQCKPAGEGPLTRGELRDGVPLAQGLIKDANPILHRHICPK